MSPYGKIRTSLSVGEGGDLDGSSLDYFIPWYDNQSTLFFSQISAQRKEDRTIGNLGLAFARTSATGCLAATHSMTTILRAVTVD